MKKTSTRTSKTRKVAPPMLSLKATTPGITNATHTTSKKEHTRSHRKRPADHGMISGISECDERRRRSRDVGP